jgi:hypothetical protein
MTNGTRLSDKVDLRTFETLAVLAVLEDSHGNATIIL